MTCAGHLWSLEGTFDMAACEASVTGELALALRMRVAEGNRVGTLQRYLDIAAFD